MAKAIDRIARVVGITAMTCVSASLAQAQTTTSPAADPVSESVVEPAAPMAGILPLPDYTGDLWHRAFLTGDWGGTRTNLANKGLQFQVDWNQYVQGVVDGGRDETTRYGGSLDYRANLDLMRMGVLDGALVKFRAQTRYGNSVNTQAGPILPVNTDAFFPLTSPIDDDIAITITNLNYTQFLSPKLAIMAGKIDTLDGDPNEFASGRGTSQFMNSNFVFNPVLALRLPYSTLAAAVIWMPIQESDKALTVVNTIMNTVDSSTTSGFSDFGDGTTWNVEANLQYRLGRLPGGMNLGFLYSFDQDFTKIGGDFIFVPGQGLTTETADDTWAAYWSGWQYLFVEDDIDAPIVLANGMPDRQGVGLFARAGIADEDTNPIEWSLSGGIGGRGILPSRDNDTFGIGFYYTGIQTTLISGVIGIDDHAQGFEAFYNIALTPAARLTLDVQVIKSPSVALDTAVILGMRLGMTF